MAAPGSASADDGYVPPIVYPPVPPEEAGNPVPVTIDATKIPDVAPIVIHTPAPRTKKCPPAKGDKKQRKKCKKRPR
jgi:hypothetical protein